MQVHGAKQGGTSVRAAGCSAKHIHPMTIANRLPITGHFLAVRAAVNNKHFQNVPDASSIATLGAPCPPPSLNHPDLQAPAAAISRTTRSIAAPQATTPSGQPSEGYPSAAAATPPMDVSARAPQHTPQCGRCAGGGPRVGGCAGLGSANICANATLRVPVAPLLQTFGPSLMHAGLRAPVGPLVWAPFFLSPHFHNFRTFAPTPQCL
jgi:hypothetical protein